MMYFKVGRDEKEYAIHTGVHRRHFPYVCDSSGRFYTFTIGIGCKGEGIFLQVLQYIYNGDYSIHLLAESSVPVACEAVLDGAFLQLRDKYIGNCISTQIFLEELADLLQACTLPVCKQIDYLCKSPDALLTHAQLHIFAKKHSLDILVRLSLWKLVHALLEQVLAHPYRTEGVAELLHFASEPGTTDKDLITLMVHYVLYHLK